MRRGLLPFALLLIPSLATAQWGPRYERPFLGGTITAPILAPTTCATPAFSFTADTNAGLCLSAANVVYVQTGSGAGSNNAFMILDAGGSAGVGHYNFAGTTYSMIGATGSSTIFGYLDSVQYLLLGTTGLTVGYSTTQDQLKLVPVALGAASKIGSLTSVDLTDHRTWTYPDATGDVAVTAAAGFPARTAAAAWAARTITPSTGGTVTNGDGVSGNPAVGPDLATTPQFVGGTGRCRAAHM